MTTATTNIRLNLTPHDAPAPVAHPWLITIAVMLGTFMEVLDTSVANVALPHIAGNLSASIDESTWVLTSYLVSNAIVLPATGWLSRYFGRKRFLLTCLGIFTLASLACGSATNLQMLILARIIQGIGGGALQPIAQSILMESFPYEKRGRAMAAYALGIIFAPVIGPTIGGWITDNYSWRWIFYINIPVGVLAVFMVNTFIHDPPHIKHAARNAIDFYGLGLLALWVGTFQIILDKGQEADWFGSTSIVVASLVTVAAFIAFILRELFTQHPLVDFRVFKNRNFLIGTTLIFVVGIVLYSSTALLPLFLQNLMGYTALQSGLAVSPRGVGSLVAILIVGRIIGKIDSRYIISFALALLAYSCYLLGKLDLDVASSDVIWPIAISGLALPSIFVPLTTATNATMPTAQLGNSAGIYNLMRNLGGSVGIAMVTTLLSRNAQRAQVTLAAHITPYDFAARQKYELLQHSFAHGTNAVAAGAHARAVMYQELLQQSSLMAFISNFNLLAVLCLCCIPLVFLFQKGSAPVAHKK